MRDAAHLTSLAESLSDLVEPEQLMVAHGQLLRALRREVLGLSQTRYSELVGISRRTLSDLEGDKGNVTLEVKNRVFRPLGLEVSLLPRKRSLLEQALSPNQ